MHINLWKIWSYKMFIHSIPLTKHKTLTQQTSCNILTTNRMLFFPVNKNVWCTEIISRRRSTTNTIIEQFQQSYHTQYSLGKNISIVQKVNCVSYWRGWTRAPIPSSCFATRIDNTWCTNSRIRIQKRELG